MESSADPSVSNSKLLGGSFLFLLFLTIELIFIAIIFHSSKEGQFAASAIFLIFGITFAIVGHGMFKRIFRFSGTNALVLPSFYSKLSRISSVSLKLGIWGGITILLANLAWGLYVWGFTNWPNHGFVTSLMAIGVWLLSIVAGPIAIITPGAILIWCALMAIWTVILLCLFMPLIFNRDRIPKDSYIKYLKNFYCLIPAIILFIIFIKDALF